MAGATATLNPTGPSQGAPGDKVTFTYTWDYADCAASSKDPASLVAVLNWDNPVETIGKATVAASAKDGSCNASVTGQVPSDSASGDHYASAYLEDPNNGGSPVPNSDAKAGQPFVVVIAVTATAQPTASSTATAKPTSTSTATAVPATPAAATSAGSPGPFVFALVVVIAALFGGVVTAVAVSRRRRSAPAGVLTGSSMPQVLPQPSTGQVALPQPSTGKAPATSAEPARQRADMRPGPVLHPTFQAAGFTRQGPLILASDVPGLVPLGGDYWKKTVFPLTRADHVLRGPSQQPKGDDSVFIGPFEITARYLTLCFGGQGSTLRGFVSGTVVPQGASELGRPTMQLGSKTWAPLDQDVHGNGPTLAPVTWDLQPHSGSQIVLQIVRPGGSIISDEEPLITDASRLRNWRPPIWGFADLHCHPMAAKGFGGGFIAGDYDPTTPASEIAPCDQPAPPHQPHYRDIGDVVVNMWPDGHQAAASFSTDHNFFSFPRGTDGGPTFRNWPRFLEGIHQQMHPEWIRRARDGGQRLMVGLVVHDELIAEQHVVHDELPHDDWSVTLRQVEYWNQVCAANSDVMAIATSPEQARAIIASNRVAIVLGLEVDSALGRWRHVNDVLRDAHLHSGIGQPNDYNITPELLLAVREVIRIQLLEIWHLGIRQINPVHLVNNAIGYATVYDEAFNISQEMVYHEDFQVEAADDVDFRLGQDTEREWLTYLGAGLQGYSPPTAAWDAVGSDSVTFNGRVFLVPRQGHVNAGNPFYGPYGLTPVGNIAIEEMIRMGFIIDMDHMSRKTADAVLGKAEGNAASWTDARPHQPYPVISAHCNFTELAPRRHYADQLNPGPGQRAHNKYWPHESMKTAAQIERIRALGGLAAPITTILDAIQYSGPDGSRVENDCPGTTKSWAQEFMYAVDHMHGPVALGTDMALLRQLGPRFGPNAAYGLTDEILPAARLERRTDAFRQDNGVRYVGVIHNPLPYFTPPDVRAEWTQNPYVWPQDSAIDVGLGGRYAFATALWDAIQRTSRGPFHWSDPFVGWFDSTPGAARDVVHGFTAFNESSARARGPLALLAFQLFNNLPVSDPGDPHDTRSDHRLVSDALMMWDRMSGSNDPLTRCTTGSRDWDYNTDGLAHYGLLPDMLQDLTNVGLPDAYMSALMLSADAYINLWERCSHWERAEFEAARASWANTLVSNLLHH
jgi:hypothetical protein